MSKLSSEKKAILEAFESGKLKRIKNQHLELPWHRKAAAATFTKDNRISIWISSKDLRDQKLVSSVLHKFVEGQMVEQATGKRLEPMCSKQRTRLVTLPRIAAARMRRSQTCRSPNDGRSAPKKCFSFSRRRWAGQCRAALAAVRTRIRRLSDGGLNLPSTGGSARNNR